jgi:hypothetical protein
MANCSALRKEFCSWRELMSRQQLGSKGSLHLPPPTSRSDNVISELRPYGRDVQGVTCNEK